MGLGNRSLPSRAACTNPHVTFPVVTVSGCHSLMLSVERLRMSGGKAAAPSPPALAFEDLTPACSRLPLRRTGKGKSTHP